MQIQTIRTAIRNYFNNSKNLKKSIRKNILQKLKRHETFSIVYNFHTLAGSIKVRPSRLKVELDAAFINSQ